MIVSDPKVYRKMKECVAEIKYETLIVTNVENNVLLRVFCQMNLPVREDKQRGVYVAGATEEYVTSADEVRGRCCSWW